LAQTRTRRKVEEFAIVDLVIVDLFKDFAKDELARRVLRPVA